jgi:hypothetical protein
MKTRYFFGAALARAGDEMTGPAVVLLAFAVTRTAGMGSVLMACLTIAAAVGGPALGAALDRSRRPERTLGYVLAGYAAGILVVQATVGRGPLVIAAVCALAAGTLSPAVAGGWTSQLARVVTPAELPRSSALDAMTFNTASLAGPGLAALVTLWLGARIAVMVAACLVAIAVPAALRLTSESRRAHRARQPHGPQYLTTSITRSTRPSEVNHAIAPSGGGGSLAGEVVAGLAAIVERPALLRATATSAVSYAGIGMLIVCCPLLGAQRLGGSAHGALLLTTLAATSLAANGLLTRRRFARITRIAPDTRVLVSTLVIGVSLAMVALAPGWFTVLAVAVDGAGEGPQLTALFEVRYREAPPALRGRVFTTAASVKIGGLAAGAALAGPLAGWSLTGCLLVAGGVEACAACTYLLIRTGITTVSSEPDILAS